MQSKKFELKIYWLITDDFAQHERKESPYEILFLSDFKNSLEIIEKIKPDAIYHSVGYNIINYAFIVAEKLQNIPSFGYADSAISESFEFNISIGFRLTVFKEHIRQFFEKKPIGKNNQIKKIRGIIFLKKYLFLIKSLRASGKSYIKTISELLTLIKIGYISKSKFNTKFNCDLIFVENLRSAEYNISTGLKKENMVIVGNPIYDVVFEKQTQTIDVDNKNLKVLFLTVNLSGGQGKSDWSILKRDKMIKEMIESIAEYNKIDLIIKIHPIAENYLHYEKLLEMRKDIKVIQNGDIIELISNADVILTSCTSTAGTIALIMKKPIVVWNYFNVKQDFFLRKEIVLECKKSSELLNCLYKAKLFRMQNNEKIEKVIKEEFVDGKSVQKIVNELEKWLNKIGIN